VPRSRSRLEVSADQPVDARPIRQPSQRHLLANSSLSGQAPAERHRDRRARIHGGCSTRAPRRRQGIARALVNAWRLEPVRRASSARASNFRPTATRLGKGAVQVVVHSPHVLPGARRTDRILERLCAGPCATAAVHGLERPEEREAPPASQKLARFDLAAGVHQGRLFVEIADSGPGVDWAAVRARASQRGLPSARRRSSRPPCSWTVFSTTDDATEMSGRGVGLSAVRAAVSGSRRSRADHGRGRRHEIPLSWPTRQFKNLIQFDIGAAS